MRTQTNAGKRDGFGIWFFSFDRNCLAGIQVLVAAAHVWAILVNCGGRMGGIFISHSHDDKPITDALAELIGALFGDRVAVNYSSRKEEGGIPPGEDWFRWIVEQVRDTELALIILTPGAIQKPWVIWEAGAVAGAAFANSLERTRVIPITFGVKGSQVPTPLARLQIVSGTDAADVTKLLNDLFDRLREGLSPNEMVRFGARQEAAVRHFMDRIAGILLRLPLVITEAAIAEWLERLDELVRDDRVSETMVIENWMDVAFGRDSEDRQRPLDVRVHRRLGELYAKADRAADAVRQFQLARHLAPRDIFLLRRLGKAYLDIKDSANAAAILEEIELLDATAFKRNVENAALKARWHEQNNDLIGAREVLTAAYSHLPESYYLGDRLGQLLVRLGDREKAREVYLQVRRSLRELREQNVWTGATALSAALVCEDSAAAAAALSQLRDLRPSREELRSIERGIAALVEALQGDPSILNALREIET